MTVLFRPAAASDLEDVYGWYEALREGFGQEFLDAAHAAIEAAAVNPLLGGTVHRDVRRVFLRRFPYGLFYRADAERILVFACFHAKRDPRVWKPRR